MQLTPPDGPGRPSQSEREPLKPDELKQWLSERERQDAQTLVEITSADFERAVSVLRKHDGDMQKAADVLLRPQDPEDAQFDSLRAGAKESFPHLFQNDSKKDNNKMEVIDLTGDDDDAMTLGPRFRATTRSPKPEWQMVRSSQAKTAEEDLHKAIEASYNDFTADESDHVPPDEIGLREGGRPIALRAADAPAKAYAALILHSLFHVPQVRQQCSQLRLHLVDGNKPETYPDFAIWRLIEMYTALDLADISVFLDMDLIQAWETLPLTPNSSLSSISKQFLEKVVNVLQKDLDEQEVNQKLNVGRLFHFTYCKIHSPVSGPPEKVFETNAGHVVPIEISHHPDSNNNSEGGDLVAHSIAGGAEANALVTRLSQTFNIYHADGSSEHTLLKEPSEVVTFEISVVPSAGVSSSTSGGATATSTDTNTSKTVETDKPREPEPLTYPKTLYMDEFLEANLDLANETRAAQRQIRKEMDGLVKRKMGIVKFEDQDTFANLRGSIDYYENIAHCDSPERLATLRKMAGKLKNSLTKLEAEVAGIDRELAQLQAELDEASDNPELRCHPYDLRAVLIHTGLPGRKHMYSYVQDTKGVWWKTVDWMVSEVAEDVVLSDSTGLHLGAGPYMLMYSCRQPESELSRKVEWPPLFVNTILENNTLLREAEAQRARERERAEVGRKEDADAMDTS